MSFRAHAYIGAIIGMLLGTIAAILLVIGIPVHNLAIAALIGLGSAGLVGTWGIAIGALIYLIKQEIR